MWILLNNSCETGSTIKVSNLSSHTTILALFKFVMKSDLCFFSWCICCRLAYLQCILQKAPSAVNSLISCEHLFSFHCFPAVDHWFVFRYWRYNEEMRTMDPGYPKPISVWRGVPESPQGAFVDKANGRILSCPILSSGSSCAVMCQATLISAGHWHTLFRS